MENDTDIGELSEGIKQRGYLLLESLGSGGFGLVYRAEQISSGQHVAIKILKNVTNQENIQKKIQRFKREIAICAELAHPHIVKLIDKHCLTEDRFFAVFEYIPGNTLKNVLLHKPNLSVVEAGNYMTQILDALAYAHAKGIVHRDLKPHNIMITRTETQAHVKLLDFGISTIIPQLNKIDFNKITRSNETVGTPSYSAPEQLRGDSPTIKSDLYSWGLIFLECITGSPVIQGESLAEIYYNQMSPAEIHIPPAIAGHELGNILRKVLKKNPYERVGDTVQIYRELCKINLNTLVGDFVDNRMVVDSSAEEDTQIHSCSWMGIRCELRQITILCCHVNVKALGIRNPEFEIVESVRSDQMAHCRDIVQRFGGTISGTIGSYQIFHFGYPIKSDCDTRLAVKSAFDLIKDVHKRSVNLEQYYNIEIELSIGLHTGTCLIREKEMLSGKTHDIALRLATVAQPGTILISSTTKELIDPWSEIEIENSKSICHEDVTLHIYSLKGEKLIRFRTLPFAQLRRTSIPMIGRQNEFNYIVNYFESYNENRNRTLLISGEAGIGKSRLAYEALLDLFKKGHDIKTVRCLPEYVNNALYPFLELLKDNIQYSSTDAVDTVIDRMERELEVCGCNLELAIPVLCSWMFLPLPERIKPVPHSPERQKRILINVMEQYVTYTYRKMPGIIFIEDLQWMDITSMKLLNNMIVGNNRLFVFLTARPEFINPWDEKLVRQLHLRHLPAPAAEDMILRLIENRIVEKQTLTKLVNRTDGIPLYIEELVRMLMDNHYFMERDGELVLYNGTQLDAIPVTLQELLETRLNGLGWEKEIIQIASVIGRKFRFSLLSMILQTDDVNVQHALDSAISADLICTTQADGQMYYFRHELIRDVAYNSMPLSKRKETHRLVAEIFEHHFHRSAFEEPAILAHHFGLAGLYEKAIHYGTIAANITLQGPLYENTMDQCNEGLFDGSDYRSRFNHSCSGCDKEIIAAMKTPMSVISCNELYSCVIAREKIVW